MPCFNIMHHPEISVIVQTLDDYFLISAPQSTTSIKGSKLDWGNENSIILTRELINGRLEIVIKGDDKDDDSVQLNYYRNGTKDDCDKRFEISDGDFSLPTISKAIRSAVLYDSTSPPLPQKDADTWLDR